MSAHKIIGIGFHKTGTTTLGSCMRMLGYNHISCNREAFLLYKESEISALIKLMKYFDSFDDWPWALIYREAYKAFPDSKFILTTRIDEEKWFESLSKHVERGAGERFPYRKYIYGYEKPNENKPFHIKKYQEHNSNVRDFFKDKPESFLEVCWEKGDGWKEIGNFLGIDTTGLSLPHSNKADAKASKVEKLSNRIINVARTISREKSKS
ncbi:sulfotransferase [Motiliproteus sp. SC1-56]|uniref:sulfotransferase n=1 Tax=Motiliproteus sp. SC1-56 TaxID=2799565 RepID=UPI001A90AB26|nr:sulfotransferase [Motiliproteus sp. SC1-56]